MNVLLINPPRSLHNGILSHATDDALPFIHRKLIGPPLGLLTVAAAVEHLCEIAVLDIKGELDLPTNTASPEQLVREALERYRPDIVGVTTIASEHNAALDILRVVRSVDPHILTVAGGLHTTLCPQDYRDDCVDVVCPGQSAPIFADIVRAVTAATPLTEVCGIAINRPEGLQPTRPLPHPVDATDREFIRPNREYLKRWLSTYVVGGSTDPATYLFSSLGCAHRCTFCSIWPQFDGRQYQRRADSIIEELETLTDYPVVRFADANTRLDDGFIDRLFGQIVDRGIDKTFIMDLRADAIVAHPGLIEKLARGGLKVVICGFESFRSEELSTYHKSITARQIDQAVEILHANGIMIRGNYLVPSTYTADDFTALADFAGSHRVAYAGYTILTPMPGTAYFDQARGAIVEWNLDKYNFFNCVFEPTLPLEAFYQQVAALWAIRKGDQVI